MKSYWIVAVLVLFLTWPSGSKAYVAGVDQARTEEQTVQPANHSNPSVSSSQASVKPQVPAATEAVGSAPVAASAAAPMSAQPKASYMLVELSKTLKAKKLKPGDKIKAHVSQDVIAHGKIIIPVETELIGHVTEVSVRADGNSESRLGIVFDRIVLKRYQDINFQAVVQAVAGPVQRKSRVDEPSQMLPPSMMGGDRQSSPVSRSSAGNHGATTGSSPSMSAGSASVNLQTPVTVRESHTTNAASGTSTAQQETTLSIGMPQGVTGLKGMSLSSSETALTPGPVVVSNTGNVKLESGTQILLRVTRVELPKQAAK